MLWLILILVIAFGVAHIYDAGVFGRYIPRYMENIVETQQTSSTSINERLGHINERLEQTNISLATLSKGK